MKNMLAPFLTWFDTNSTRRDYGLSFALGLLATLSMAPFYAVPVLFVVFPLLLRLLDKSLTTKQIFLKTFLFHFGFHVAGLYWVAAALFVDVQNNWWAIPFAIMSLPALMAFYPALAAALWHRLGWYGIPRIILLSVLLALSEWLRGWVFTGFPWNLWGYAWVGFLPALQITSLIGIYGLTLLTLMLAFLPALLSRNYKQNSGALFALLLVMGFVALTAWGQGRLSHPVAMNEPAFNIRIVQPNIKQEAKWDQEKRDHNEHTLWKLTLTPAETVPNFVIWPETSIALLSTSDVRRHEGNIQNLFWDGATLAAGVFEIEYDTDQKPVFSNRISFYDRTNGRLAIFDKHHLVPFGEFLPFQDYWPVKPVAFRGGSMTPGTGIKTIDGLPFPAPSPLICYEVIFSGDVADRANRPQWLLNVTNDGWYGDTTGPHQHLGISQTRAVEEGLPLVRAANTGISAVIDPMGRIVKSLPLGVSGVVDQNLPLALKPTLFARFGNSIFTALLLVFFGLAWSLQMFGVRKFNHVA